MFENTCKKIEYAVIFNFLRLAQILLFILMEDYMTNGKVN